MKRSKEIWVALLVIAGIVVFVWGYNFLKGQSFFDDKEHYYVVYKQADGVSLENKVQINGFTVGRVSQVRLLPEQHNHILVEFNITESNVRIPRKSVARIVSLDLLGERAVKLEYDEENQLAGNFYEPGDTLHGLIDGSIEDQVRAQIEPLKLKTTKLIEEVDSVVRIFQTIFNNDMQNTLDQSFESIRRGFLTFENTAYEVDSLVRRERVNVELIIGNVESITRNVRQNNERLTNLIANASDLSDTLKAAEISSTIASANAALKDLEELVEMVNSGQGTMGKFMHNDSLYNNLNSTSANLNNLVLDMTENPHKYVHLSVFDMHREGKVKKKAKRGKLEQELDQIKEDVDAIRKDLKAPK